MATLCQKIMSGRIMPSQKLINAMVKGQALITEAKMHGQSADNVWGASFPNPSFRTANMSGQNRIIFCAVFNSSSLAKKVEWVCFEK